MLAGAPLVRRAAIVTKIKPPRTRAAA